MINKNIIKIKKYLNYLIKFKLFINITKYINFAY